MVVCRIILIDNVEPSLKDNSEYALLCSLLKVQQIFLPALQWNTVGYQNFEFEISYF